SASPSVIVIDDLHEADDETVDIFLRLVSRAPSAQFALLASFQTEGLQGERLRRLLEGHGAAPYIRSVRLAPFDLQDTYEYLSQALGPFRDLRALAEKAHAATMGNPLLLAELLDDLLETSSLSGGPYR